jgi:hypothetical protein
MNSDLKMGYEMLSNFAILQYTNAMIARAVKPIGLRERIIYFIFFESAAFVCLSGSYKIIFWS